MRQAMADKELRDKLEARAWNWPALPTGRSPNEFAALLRQDIAKWAQIIEDLRSHH